ncbi:MAG TPA: S8 family serine peptidase, partial [Bacteroides reticulotermitis]|nr:S8 family serine peptidase [Bacteroides reticulotermitis]
PIVAIIGTGMDVEHEDLKHAIWVNPKEKANQKDDDKNGLIDDINGWNFLGGRDGRVMEQVMREGDREFFRLKDKYADFMWDGKKYYKIVNGKRQEVPAPANMDEYKYYTSQIKPESPVAGAYSGLQFSYVIEEYMHKFDRDMKKRFPGKELTLTEFETCYDPKAERDSLSEVAFVFAGYGFGIYKTDKWQAVLERLGGMCVKTAQDSYEKALNEFGTDQREDIIGDNYLDITDAGYGNNVLFTSDAPVGVMKAGIIAAKRDNGLGSNGIADHARIMTLRVDPTGNGEPYLKDMVLAIRYAISHGADVILLSQQNTLYPEDQKQWITGALKEAEKKGVLVIAPVWDLSIDMDKTTFYPNRNMSPNTELTNLMVVASSDKQGNPVLTSNYGAKSLDIYAPGTDIYSSYPGNTYRLGSGVTLSSSTVAGVAALLKTYFPQLTGTQLRDILLKSVTSRKGVEVEKGILVNNNETQDLFLFDDLSLSGGIVNAYQAVLEAEKMK